MRRGMFRRSNVTNLIFVFAGKSGVYFGMDRYSARAEVAQEFLLPKGHYYGSEFIGYISIK